VGATEPLVYLRAQLATGRDLDILTEASLRHPFSGLRERSERIEAALYAAELTDALLEERQGAPELFDLLLSTLYLLEGASRAAVAIRRFEAQALDAAGYTPELRCCVSCRARRPDDRGAAFCAGLGGILCSRCRGGRQDLVTATAGALNTLEKLLRLPAHAVASFEIPPEEDARIRTILRAHREHHVERRVRSCAP